MGWITRTTQIAGALAATTLILFGPVLARAEAFAWAQAPNRATVLAAAPANRVEMMLRCEVVAGASPQNCIVTREAKLDAHGVRVSFSFLPEEEALGPPPTALIEALRARADEQAGKNGREVEILFDWPSGTVETKLAPFLRVPVAALLANPKRFDGKWIETTGFLNLEFEGNRLYVGRDDWRSFSTFNSILAEPPDRYYGVKAEAWIPRTVRVAGRFFAYPESGWDGSQGYLRHIQIHEMDSQPFVNYEVWRLYRAGPRWRIVLAALVLGSLAAWLVFRRVRG